MTDAYDLDAAYQINGPEDARRMYGDWAPTYDQSFGAAWGYVAPREIAAILMAEIGPDAAILDIGAGTGLVAEHLRGMTVDALDITPEMLEIARPKDLYRKLMLGDLTKTLDLPDASYDAVISCGTFTHGHVGPECLPELLRVTRPGAVFACGTIGPVLDGVAGHPDLRRCGSPPQRRPRAGDGVPQALTAFTCRLSDGGLYRRQQLRRGPNLPLPKVTGGPLGPPFCFWNP
jgi:SAM-dependent methyltransferase